MFTIQDGMFPLYGLNIKNVIKYGIHPLDNEYSEIKVTEHLLNFLKLNTRMK